MNAQTSGCMRQVSSRNRPRSGGIVASSPSRCSSTEAPAPSRVHALRDLRELLRVAEQDDVARGGADRERVGERHLARLVDEQVVERLVHLLAREEPRRAGDQLHVVRAAKSSLLAAVSRSKSTVVARLLAAAALLQAAELDTALAARDASTSSSRLWIALWLCRRDADALARAHQVDDQPRAGPGLARAGRALDEQVAAGRAPTSSLAARRRIAPASALAPPIAAARAARTSCEAR